jgi:hypothetical protein
VQPANNVPTSDPAAALQFCRQRAALLENSNTTAIEEANLPAFYQRLASTLAPLFD